MEKRVTCLLGLIAGAALTASWVSGCVRPRARSAGPRIAFEVTRRDLGRLLAGDTKEARFPVRNEGSAPLNITAVEGGCGCLTSDFPRLLPPGGAGEIRVKFTPQALWRGKTEKTLKVRSDDSSQAEAPLTLSADVVPLIAMEPATAPVVQYNPGQVFRREIRLIPRQGSNIVLSKPAPSSPVVKATLDPPAPSDPDRAYRLHLVIGPCNGPGDMTAQVQIATTYSQMPFMPVVVVMLAKTGVAVSPPQVFVPMVTPGSEGKELRRMQVFSRSGPLRILEIDTGNPGLKAEVEEQTPARFYQVILRYAGGWKPGAVESTIRVRTDDPRFPVMTVPFHATVQ